MGVLDRADSPEYTARWLPQYDDNSDDEGTVGGYYPQCANGGMAMSMFNDSRLQSNVDDGFEVYDDGEEDGSLQDGLMHNSQSAVIATGVLPTGVLVCPSFVSVCGFTALHSLYVA